MFSSPPPRATIPDTDPESHCILAGLVRAILGGLSAGTGIVEEGGGGDGSCVAPRLSILRLVLPPPSSLTH